MVEIPDDAARDDAQWLRTFWMMDETLSPGAIDRAKRVADRLDPPKPPPTLAERMVEASRRSGFGDSAEDGMVRALAVVRAAVKDEMERKYPPDFPSQWGAGYLEARRDVLDLLGGEGGCG